MNRNSRKLNPSGRTRNNGVNIRTASLAAASGLLLAASFPSIDLHFVAWVAFIPLFLALRNQSIRGGAWLGGLAGIIYFAGTVHWGTNSVHFYGGIRTIPASLITLLLCAYLALYPALFGAAAAHLRSASPRLFFVAAPALWTSLELARTYVISGFPWSLLGYTQYSVLPVIQIADITGVYGISFLIVLVNASLAGLVMDRKNYTAVIASALIMAMVLGYGYVKLRQ